MDRGAKGAKEDHGRRGLIRYGRGGRQQHVLRSTGKRACDKTMVLSHIITP